MRSIEHAFDGPRQSSGRALARPARRRDQSSPQAPARLTRRGRLVVVAVTLLLLIVAGFTLGRVSSQAAGPARPLPTVTVAPGQTLWTIAARVDSHTDRRLLVAEIERLNGLSDGRVRVGQQLRLPR